MIIGSFCSHTARLATHNQCIEQSAGRAQNTPPLRSADTVLVENPRPLARNGEGEIRSVSAMQCGQEAIGCMAENYHPTAARVQLLSGHAGALRRLLRAAVGRGPGRRLPAGLSRPGAVAGAGVARGVLAGRRRCAAGDGAAGALDAGAGEWAGGGEGSLNWGSCFKSESCSRLSDKR